jgi:hypothetical protein
LADGAVDRMEQKLNAFLNEVPRQAQAISESAEPDPDFTAEQTMEAASAFVIHEGITVALTFTSQELAEATQQRAETVAAFLDRLSMPLLDGDGTIPTLFASDASSHRPIVFYRGQYVVGIPGRLARDRAVLLDAPMSAVSKGIDRQEDRVVRSTATGLISGMLHNAPEIHTSLL